MYALRTPFEVFGPVRCGVSDEKNTAPPALTSAIAGVEGGVSN
jgi:hypothetical protein